MNVVQSIRSRWIALPAAVRWNGGTLAAGALVAAVVHVTTAGPAVSQARVLPAKVQTAGPSIQKIARPNPPPDRNLFSLDWNRRVAASPAAAPDDPGFWSDVARPLKNPRPAGRAR